jgi:Rrf2 family protein
MPLTVAGQWRIRTAFPFIPRRVESTSASIVEAADGKQMEGDAVVYPFFPGAASYNRVVMKLSTQEEYGLRCLLHLARAGDGKSLTIPEISRAEGLTAPNVAKLMRLLRMGGLVRSARGQSGGYKLARPADTITVSSALHVLGRPIYGPDFCDRHSGKEELCTHLFDCSLRSLWSAVQEVLTEVLGKTTLADLLCGEQEMSRRIEDQTGAEVPHRSPSSSAASMRHGA